MLPTTNGQIDVSSKDDQWANMLRRSIPRGFYTCRQCVFGCLIIRVFTKRDVYYNQQVHSYVIWEEIL